MNLLISSVLITSLLTASLPALAEHSEDSFYKVGKRYAFVPRLDKMYVGTVTQINSQEVVFKVEGIIKGTNCEIQNTARERHQCGDKKGYLLMDWIKDGSRSETLEKISTSGEEIAMSRAELSGKEL